MRAAALLGLTVTLVATAGACATAPDDVSTTVRQCGLIVWHKPATPQAHVEIVGDWNGWRQPGTIPEARADGWRVASIDATKGEHAFGIVEDGVWVTATDEPMTGTHDGKEVSVATAADCDHPALRVDKVETNGAGDAQIRATFVSARSGTKVDPSSVTARARDGTPMPVVGADPKTGAVVFQTSALPLGKYTYTLEGRDAAGNVAEDARATVWIDATSGGETWDPRDALVYQVMLDRYRGPNGPLAPPATPSARAGGSLAGVRAALESGEIQSLGVSALWLSPLYTNPDGEFSGTDGHEYTSYHGYWPIDSRGIDARFATEAELDEFMSAAHARGIRVLFDVVPNHVHEQHPWKKAHPDWFNQNPDCICGQGTCDWATHEKTCWFAPYLPDLDWTNDTTARAATDDVMWWFDRWDADGIRIDAVPMMPRSATRRIATAARRRYAHPGNALYVLGENFTGPNNYAGLKYDLGQFGLDGSFHFPLMWTLRDAVATEAQPLSAIDTSFRTGQTTWHGSNAVMGLIIGNHDVSRFASESAGNASADTWSSPPQPIDPTVYAKQRIALASILTLPGAPVIYYGDEVGLAGRSDPDCRRVMPAEKDLIAAQVETRALARKVGSARSCSRALRRGELRTILADDERYVFAREIDGESAFVVLTRRPTTPVDVPLGASLALYDVVTQTRVDASSGHLHVDDAPFSVHVYLAAETECAHP